MSEPASLLERVSIINMKFAKLEEATANSFNIFSILRREYDEVHLHSRFLTELLNPGGSHRLGTIFQSLFLKMLFDGTEINDDFPNADYEVTIGDYGRIDILLRGSHNVVVIENKIYANDQHRQLERYAKAFRAGKYQEDAIHVVYLTLNGGEPSEDSLGILAKERVIRLSYKSDILNWLELCAKEAYHIPHLRETIVQYMTLVKKLTGQTLSTEHKMEIVDLLLAGDNFVSALSIEQSIEKTKIKVQELVWQDLLEEFEKKGYVFRMVNHDFKAITVDVCKEYYSTKRRSYGIECAVATFGSYSVHMFVEVQHFMYYGFTASYEGVRSDKTVEHMNIVYPHIDGQINCLVNGLQKSQWWLGGWRHTEEKINFIDFRDGITAQLANPEFRRKWIEKTSAEIADLIQKFQEKVTV